MHLQIKGFSLDPMHTLDGGVIPTALRWIFGLFKGRKLTKTHLSAGCVEDANTFMESWLPCYPWEICRKVRPIRYLAKWKMVEGRTFLMYIMVPLFFCLGDKTDHYFSPLKRLLRAIHGIGGYSLKPVPRVSDPPSIYVWLPVHPVLNKCISRLLC